MSLGGILFLVVAVVSLFVFIYLIVVTARNWGVLHTIMLCFLFLECWTFMVFTAGVLEKRLHWLKIADDRSRKAVDEEAKSRVILYGAIGQQSDLSQALVPVRAELKRMTFDRGRVWRNADLIDSQNSQYRLRLKSQQPAAAADQAGADVAAAPAAQPAAGQAQAANQDVSLPAEMVVYGFSQKELNATTQVPSKYLGEFAVTESKNGEVLLRPTIPLEPGQRKAIEDGAATMWTLYELLPLDSHESFAAEGSTSSDGYYFGRMDEEALKSLLQGLPEAPENVLAEVVERYMRDGTDAKENDLPANVWTLVEMTKDDSVTVNSAEEANATVGGYFDSIGAAVDVRLKQGTEPKVAVKAGTKLLLTQKAAQTLIDNGSAKLTKKIFVRPLNAYEKAFSKNFVHRDDTNKRTLVYQRESTLIDRANQLGQAMITERQVENQKLTADVGQFQKEATFMTAQAQSLSGELEQARAKLVEMYRALHAEHDRIMKEAIH
ncbi:MAG: hypothetical protein U0892_08425 [Pirellulales bacterium]